MSVKGSRMRRSTFENRKFFLHSPFGEVMPMHISSNIQLVLNQLAPNLAQYSPEAFAQRLEEFEGRAIWFCPVSMPPGYFGARIVVYDKRHPAEDYIFYN